MVVMKDDEKAARMAGKSVLLKVGQLGWRRAVCLVEKMVAATVVQWAEWWAFLTAAQWVFGLAVR